MPAPSPSIGEKNRAQNIEEISESFKHGEWGGFSTLKLCQKGGGWMLEVVKYQDVDRLNNVQRGTFSRD